MSCVVVMGCYRSGTSAVAGILHHLGVHMGTNFQAPNLANPKGYFEDPDFLAANLAIYEAKQIADDFEHESAMYEAKKKFHNLFRHRENFGPYPGWGEDRGESRAGNHLCAGVWGFKDPKFCLTAKHVELPENTKIIWIHRNIDDTALSLIKALELYGADANMDKWRKFVEHYRDETVNFMAGCDALSTLDVTFDDVIRSPRTFINHIATFVYGRSIDDAQMHYAFDFMEQ